MRERRIVKELHENRECLNLSYLSNLLGVSTRTVANDLNYLMNIAKDNGFEIKLKRGEGYYITIHDEQKFNDFLNSGDELEIGNREHLIAAIILISNGYSTKEDLANKLQVSASLIKLKLVSVEQLLLMKGIQLEKKPHYGLKVDCSLEDRINCLVYLLTENPEIYDLLVEEDAYKKLNTIEKTFIQLVNTYDLSANYAEMVKLDNLLKVIILLTANGFINELPVSCEQTMYTDIANKIIEVINAEFGCDASSYGCVIAQWLKERTKSKNCEVNDTYFNQQMDSYLNKIDEKNKTNFSDDEYFKKILLAHVLLLVERSSQEIYFDNPLVQEISVKYPAVFNIAIQFVQMLEDEFKVKITQDEIGFIATHFAAKMEKDFKDRPDRFSRIAIICSSGGGSAYIIKLKIETLFPKSDIQTFSFFDLEEVKSFEPNIIFTIKELNEKFDVPVVRIKELFDEIDIRKIKTINTNVEQEAFIHLFKEDCFWHLDLANYETALIEMATKLEKNQYAKVGFCDYILQREKVISTVYLNGLAIPHPIEMVAIESCIAVGILKNTLHEKNNDVRVIFMVNLEKGNLEVHQKLSQICFDIMQDEKKIQSIQSVKSFDEFIEKIKTLIERSKG